MCLDYRAKSLTYCKFIINIISGQISEITQETVTQDTETQETVTQDTETQETPTRGLLFNKEADIWDNNGNLIIDFPRYFYFDFQPNQLEWIDSKDMTDEEKENYPEHKTTGGFVRVTENEKDLKYRWKKSFDKASHEDIMKTFDLPNFDADIFEEISGISLHNYRDKGKKKTITISVMG